MYVGPPGSGKTMLAKRIPTILPDMTDEEKLKVTKIYSVAGKLDAEKGLITRRPFRSPHHTITAAAMLGGGRIPRPGEITLSGSGVLFLDEMTEFRPELMESLRQPLEDKKITVLMLRIHIQRNLCLLLLLILANVVTIPIETAVTVQSMISEGI